MRVSSYIQRCRTLVCEYPRCVYNYDMFHVKRRIYKLAVTMKHRGCIYNSRLFAAHEL